MHDGGLVGIWQGMVLTMALSNVCLCAIYARQHWRAISDTIRAKALADKAADADRLLASDKSPAAAVEEGEEGPYVP